MLHGGAARGYGRPDHGGIAQIVGGSAYTGTSGSLLFQSGVSELASSGSIVIATSDAGKEGVSGALSLNTGISSAGDSGKSCPSFLFELFNYLCCFFYLTQAFLCSCSTFG